MTDDFEEALTRLVIDSWDDLDEVLKRLSGLDVVLNPAVEALVFGLLGGFTRGFKEAHDAKASFEECVNNAMGTAMTDPRVDSLIQMTLIDAVDEKVGGLIDG